MAKNSMARSLMGISSLIGASGSVGVPLYLSINKKRVANDEIVKTYSESNLDNTRETYTVSRMQDSKISVKLTQQSGITSASKRYNGFQEFGNGMQSGFNGNQKGMNEIALPGEDDLKRIFQKDGDLSGEGIVELEEGQDCKVGTNNKEAYCGFLVLSHNNKRYKLKVGYDDNYRTQNGGRKTQKGEVGVVKQTNSGGITGYSGIIGGGETCAGARTRQKAQLSNLYSCENGRWDKHFGGKSSQNTNYGGNLHGLSIVKVIR